MPGAFLFSPFPLITTARKNYTTGKKTLKEVENLYFICNFAEVWHIVPAPTTKDMQDKRIGSTF